MSFPLIYFLYIFYAAMIIWLLMSLLGLYHLFAHSNGDKKAPMIAFTYVGVSIIIAIAFFSLASNIDWTEDFNLSLPSNSGQNIIELYE